MGADSDDLFWRLALEKDVRVPGGEDHVGRGHEDVCSSRDAKVVAREGAVGWEMDKDVAVEDLVVFGLLWTGDLDRGRIPKVQGDAVICQRFGVPDGCGCADGAELLDGMDIPREERTQAGW